MDENDHDRENSDEWSDEEPVRRPHHLARPRGTRRARVDIATIEEVLGEDEEGGHGHSQSPASFRFSSRRE